MPNEDIISRILTLFRNRGGETYGSEAVTQLEHALQTASLAHQSGASSVLITAALLHDIGHLLDDDPLGEPHTRDPENLDDAHETRGSRWLSERFGPEVSDPVRLHVAAKRYLCTVEPEYLQRLSPTALQSFHDQGGPMSSAEIEAFESEANYEVALSVRRWDDTAKVPGQIAPSIEKFIPHLRASLGEGSFTASRPERTPAT